MALTFQRKLELAGALSRVQPELQRVLRDDELHKRVQSAVGSGRRVYGRVGSDRDVSRIANQLRSDKKAQKELRAFLIDLAAVSARLKEPPPAKKRHHVRHILLLGGAVGAGTLVFVRRRRSVAGSTAGNGSWTPTDFATPDTQETEPA
jgi:hypothetical protein